MLKSIDEVIEDFETMAKNARNGIIDSDDQKHYNSQLELYAKEREQNAEWLKELKKYKENEFNVLKEDGQLLYKQGILDGYNKAIDDFAEKICEILEEYQTGFNMVSMANVWHFSRELADQLKRNKK